MTIYWKTFAGRCIYRLDNVCSVHQNTLYRWLIFNNQHHILQTLIHRYTPHKPALRYLSPFTYALRASPGHTCLLGLGGGAIAHYVAPYLASHALTAIEASPDIIAVASQYFMTDTLKNLTIHQQDAQDFILHTPEMYQHILVDLYTSQGYPTTCHHRDFFTACHHRLHASGILALNLPDFHYNLDVFHNLRDVFQQATVCIPIRASSNMIILAAHTTPPLHALLYNHPYLKKFIWDAEFGCMAHL